MVSFGHLCTPTKYLYGVLASLIRTSLYMYALLWSPQWILRTLGLQPLILYRDTLWWVQDSSPGGWAWLELGRTTSNWWVFQDLMSYVGITCSAIYSCSNLRSLFSFDFQQGEYAYLVDFVPLESLVEVYCFSKTPCMVLATICDSAHAVVGRSRFTKYFITWLKSRWVRWIFVGHGK